MDANTMNPDQTASKEAVWSRFIMSSKTTYEKKIRQQVWLAG